MADDYILSDTGKARVVEDRGERSAQRDGLKERLSTSSGLEG
jgi:hypothetical protein